MTITQLFTHPRFKAKAFTYNVTTAAANRPLDLDTVKNWLKIPLTNKTQDDLLNLIIDAVTEFGEKYTGRDFINRTYTTFRDNFQDCLELRRSRVSAVASVKYLLDGVLTTVATTVWGFTDVTDFSEIFLEEDQEWPTDVDNVPQAVEVVFTSGYGATEASVPADVKLGMLNHIALVYANRGDCSSCDTSNVANLPVGLKAFYDKLRFINIGVCK